MTHDEMIAVIAAHRDGKQIQFQSMLDETAWHEYAAGEAPSWDFMRRRFRVKPEPVEAWAVVRPDGSLVSFATRKDDLLSPSWAQYKLVRMIEAPEGDK